MVELDALAKIFAKRDLDKVSDLEFRVWIGFLGPRNSYRELALQKVVEDIEIFAIYSFRIKLKTKIFFKYVSAIEVDEKEFVDLNEASEEDWRAFLERVLDGELPRIFFGKDFRENFGLPSTSAEYEARVIEIRGFEEE